MFDYDKIVKIGKNLGIKFKTMIIYRAELIHLKNEGYSIVAIAKMLNVPKERVYNWYNKESQPNDEIIQILENMFLKRELEKIKELRNPSK